MSRSLLCKSLLCVRPALLSTNSRTHNRLLLRIDPSLWLSLRYTSSDTKADERDLFRVSYLVNSCGLSPESALSVSKCFTFKTPDKPDRAINFFKNQGFSKSLIGKLVKGHSWLLQCTDPEKILLPKFEFFYSKGFSRTHLLQVLSRRSSILGLSLNDNIVPSFEFLKSFLGSDGKVITAIRRCPYIFSRCSQPCIRANVATLQHYGTPMSNIQYILVNHPSTFIANTYRLKKVAKEVKLMGINPLNISFVVAISLRCGLRKSTLESKENAFKHWGLSEKDIFSAVVKFPAILGLSTENIMATMDFLVNEMGWESSCIIRRPELVAMSLRKRIIPRCSVIRALLSKGLIKKVINLHAVFYLSEKKFLERFVTCYENDAPGLLKLYEETLNLSKNNKGKCVLSGLNPSPE